MQAVLRYPSAPAPQRRRSIGAPVEARQQRRQSFHLPQIDSSAVRRSTSKGALRSKASNAVARSRSISNASTHLKSASSSTLSLLSEDAVESLPSMPCTLPPLRERRHTLPNLSKAYSAISDSAPKRRSLPSSPLSMLCLEGHRAALPTLSLDGHDAGSSFKQFRNVALIRWIFEEARMRHVGRSSYQARQEDDDASAQKQVGKGLSSVIFREVCSDVMAATRKCCKAYRACQFLRTAVPEPRHLRRDLELKTAIQAKSFAVGVLCKMLQDVREKGDDAERMWQSCVDGLASKSLNSRVFGNRSIALD